MDFTKRLPCAILYRTIETIGRRKYAQKASRKKLDGDAEAHLIALACAEAPEGYTRMSLRLLADKMAELGYVESISHEPVRRVLKNELKPCLHKQ